MEIKLEFEKRGLGSIGLMSMILKSLVQTLRDVVCIPKYSVPIIQYIGVVPAPDGTTYLVDINGTRYWGSI